MQIPACRLELNEAGRRNPYQTRNPNKFQIRTLKFKTGIKAERAI